jgi:hypothetical protein
MSEMIEQVARAIEDNIKATLPDGVAIDYQYAARAAIEAMREPTEGMVSAMNETTIEGWDGDSFWPSKEDCTALFKVAIDAATQGRR